MTTRRIATNSTVVLACLAGAVPALAQTQTTTTAATFSTTQQSMWSSGAGFSYDYAKDFSLSHSTGWLYVNPPPTTGAGVTIDPNFALKASGALGVGVGFGLSSGLVDAELNYNIGIEAPSSAAIGEFFTFDVDVDLEPSSSLATSSPTAHASMDGILEFDSDFWAQAKVSAPPLVAIAGNIAVGTFTYSKKLVDIDLRQTLTGFNPDGTGQFYWKGAPVGGVGSVIKIGNPLAPAAEITVGDWRIDASGQPAAGASTISAQGQTTMFSTLIDMDASITGGSGVTGAKIAATLSKNVSIDAGLDILDFDSAFAIGYAQDFDLTPAVHVALSFSAPVNVQLPGGGTVATTSIGPVPVGGIPAVSLISGPVTVTPTYYVQASLRNNTDLVFDIDFDNMAGKGWLELEFKSLVFTKTVKQNFGPLWSQTVQVASATVDAYDQTFELSGFQPVPGTPFTIESSCYADCDASGSLDLFDFLCFNNAFTASDPKADCDASGSLDLFDFLCFNNAFTAGCP